MRAFCREERHFEVSTSPPLPEQRFRAARSQVSVNSFPIFFWNWTDDFVNKKSSSAKQEEVFVYRVRDKNVTKEEQVALSPNHFPERERERGMEIGRRECDSEQHFRWLFIYWRAVWFPWQCLIWVVVARERSSHSPPQTASQIPFARADYLFISVFGVISVAVHQWNPFSLHLGTAPIGRQDSRGFLFLRAVCLLRPFVLLCHFCSHAALLSSASRSSGSHRTAARFFGGSRAILKPTATIRVLSDIWVES